MKPLKVGILGAGSAASVALLVAMRVHNYNITHDLNHVHVVIIHDPKIPIAPVGESTSAGIPAIMEEVLGDYVHARRKEFSGNYKFSSRYFYEKRTGLPAFNVCQSAAGYQFDSQVWSKWIFKEVIAKYKNVIEIQDTILSIHQTENNVTVQCNEHTHTFDVIINCMGNPTKEELESEDYILDVFETVNSVVIQPEFKYYENEMFTSAHYHDNGWMFGIPIATRKAWGYLYNNKFLSEEEACAKFSAIRGGIDTTNLPKISWQPYRRKRNLEGRILYLGNKLFLLEPTNALPLHTYMNFSEIFLQKVSEDLPMSYLNIEQNRIYNEHMEKYQNLIALQYISENKLGEDTEFWKTTSAKAKHRLMNSKSFQKFLINTDLSKRMQNYSWHPACIMAEYIDGYGLDLKSLRNTKVPFDQLIYV